jgi:hypothetical protein
MLDILIRLPQRAMIRIKSQRRQRPLPPSSGERGYGDDNDGASGWKRMDASLKEGDQYLKMHTTITSLIAAHTKCCAWTRSEHFPAKRRAAATLQQTL